MCSPHVERPIRIARADVELTRSVIVHKDRSRAGFHLNNANRLLIPGLESGFDEWNELRTEMIVQRLNQCLEESVTVLPAEAVHVSFDTIDFTVIGHTDDECRSSSFLSVSLSLLVHGVLPKIPKRTSGFACSTARNAAKRA